MSVFYTEDCIYFNSKDQSVDFQKYEKETHDYRTNSKTRLESFAEKVSRRKKKKRGWSELLISGSLDLPIEQKFSFLHLRTDAIIEDLGQTMDISRETIRPFLKREYDVPPQKDSGANKYYRKINPSEKRE